MQDLSIVMDRAIGQRQILLIMEKMYGHTTWPGALGFIKRHHLPLRRTPSNRPYFLLHELVLFDGRFQEFLSGDNG